MENRTNALSPVKGDNLYKECVDALELFSDAEMKKMVFQRLTSVADSPELLKLAVEQYLVTADEDFLQRMLDAVEGILNNSRYESGFYGEAADNIRKVFVQSYATNSEVLCVWLENLACVVLKYAPVRKCDEFFVVIEDIAKEYHIEMNDLLIVLMQHYKEQLGNGNKLLKVLSSCKPTSIFNIPGCTMVTNTKVGDTYLEGPCDPTRCKINEKIYYFTAATCLYKIWSDSRRWSYADGFDLGLKMHEELCGYVKEAYRLIEGSQCQNECIPTALFRAQYEQFTRTYECL